MIEVRIPDDVTDPLEVLRRLRDAGIPVRSRPRFDTYGKYDPVVVVDRGRLEWISNGPTCDDVFRWRE